MLACAKSGGRNTKKSCDTATLNKKKNGEPLRCKIRSSEFCKIVGNIESVSKLHCKYLCLEIVLEEGEGKGRVEVNYDGQVLRVNATSGKRFYISNFIFS